MKGILLKDLYAMKKNLIITLFICIYFLMILLVGSGNSSTSEINIVIYFLCGIVPCFFSSCFMLIIEENPYSKQSLYLHSLPLDNRTLAIEKYIILYALQLAGYLIISFAVLIDVLLNDYRPDTDTLFYCFIIFSALLVISNIELPLTMRFGQAIAAGYIISFICLIIVLGIYVIAKKENFLSAFDRKLPIVLVAIACDIISTYLSYSFTKRIAKKV